MGGGSESSSDKEVVTRTTTNIRDIGLTGANATQLAEIFSNASVATENIRAQNFETLVQEAGDTFGQLIGGAEGITRTAESAVTDITGSAENVAGQLLGSAQSVRAGAESTAQSIIGNARAAARQTLETAEEVNQSLVNPGKDSELADRFIPVLIVAVAIIPLVLRRT